MKGVAATDRDGREFKGKGQKESQKLRFPGCHTSLEQEKSDETGVGAKRLNQVCERVLLKGNVRGRKSGTRPCAAVIPKNAAAGLARKSFAKGGSETKSCWGKPYVFNLKSVQEDRNSQEISNNGE